MPNAEAPNKDALIADAISSLAQEIRYLTFGRADIREVKRGAIEDLSFSVTDSGKDISIAIGEVAQSLSEVAESIKILADAVALSHATQKDMD